MGQALSLRGALSPALLAAISFTASLTAAEPPQLRYVVIVTRHGVRAPTWNAERLNLYSAQPWPEWSVPPGNLTPHGRTLIQLMGAYYREWLSSERLLHRPGCSDATRVYIHADTDQRTLETGRALAETLLPGCPVAVHAAPPGAKDPLFDPIEAGVSMPDWETAATAVRARLNSANLHRPAFVALESVLAGPGGAPRQPIQPPAEIAVSVTAKSIQLNEPWNAASTLSEDLLLEYANGMQGKDLGWGRLDAQTLLQVLALHTTHSDLMRRTPYLARARGSNLLDRVRRSLQQAVTGKAVPGALGPPDAALLIVVGHDTNLSNLSGILGLSWRLPGYQPDDTPPGGALVFSLWQQPDTAQYFVRTRYLAQTLAQMRDATPLTLAAPPAIQDLAVAPWETFAQALRKAIDNRFVSVGAIMEGGIYPARGFSPAATPQQM